MQPIDRSNGCLFVQPGSHRRSLLPHSYPSDGVVNAAYHGIHSLTERDGEAMQQLHMEEGDCVFFHPLLIHGSGRNNSTQFRKAISTHFAASECKYYDVSNTVQEEIKKEAEAMAKKRGNNCTFNDYWRNKSRLVKGKELTLI